MNPKISIITVVRNGVKYIEETIQSVIHQTYNKIEYIIIDGESTDGTLNIVEKYKSHLDYFLSEKDVSMYDAINKGLKKCTGDYILVLNSDDTLVSTTTIEKISKLLIGDSAYYCNVIIQTEQKEKERKLFQVNFKQLLLSKHCTFVPHPSFFVSRNLLIKKPEYDLKYKYASDFDYILDLFKISSNIKHLNIFCTKFRYHDESITASGKLDQERLAIIKIHGYYNFNILTRNLSYFYLWVKYKMINLS